MHASLLTKASSDLNKDNTGHETMRNHHKRSSSDLAFSILFHNCWQAGFISFGVTLFFFFFFFLKGLQPQVILRAHLFLQSATGSPDKKQ